MMTIMVVATAGERDGSKGVSVGGREGRESKKNKQMKDQITTSKLHLGAQTNAQSPYVIVLVYICL